MKKKHATIIKNTGINGYNKSMFIILFKDY